MRIARAQMKSAIFAIVRVGAGEKSVIVSHDEVFEPSRNSTSKPGLNRGFVHVQAIRRPPNATAGRGGRTRIAPASLHNVISDSRSATS